MKEKVIAVNVNSAVGKKDGNSTYEELEFPKLKAALDEGYQVRSFHSVSPSDNLYCSTLIFVLSK